MAEPSTRPATRAHRAVVGAVLVLAVTVTGGLPALSAGVPSGPLTGMTELTGMTAMTGMSADARGSLPAGITERITVVVGCDAMCGDLLHACLATLVFVAASALALPSAQRLLQSTSPEGRHGPWT